MPEETKTCPFCAGTIRNAAVRCHRCGRFLPMQAGSIARRKPRLRADNDLLSFAIALMIAMSLSILAVRLVGATEHQEARRSPAPASSVQQPDHRNFARLLPSRLELGKQASIQEPTD